MKAEGWCLGVGMGLAGGEQRGGVGRPKQVCMYEKAIMKLITLNANKNETIKTPNKQQSQKTAHVSPIIKTASFAQETEGQLRKALTSVLSRHVNYQLVTVLPI